MEGTHSYETLREKHPGWCTIESDPEIFNQILRDARVTNVKVEEIYSLDHDIISKSSSTIGLVFLSKWDTGHAEDGPAENRCPTGVWFANQVSDGSCASLALLNILFNSTQASLGSEFTHFKEFTSALTPPLKGLAVQNFEFLRRIHNSYARRSEILQNNIDALGATRKSRGSIRQEVVGEEDNAYHFIAYVSCNGKLWELDGLRRYPVNIESDSTEHWLHAAMPRIESRISRFSENEMMFTLLVIRVTDSNGFTVTNEPDLRSEKIKNVEFPYALRMRKSYVPFMRAYIQNLADKGVHIGA